MPIKVKILRTNNWLKDNGYSLEDELEIYNSQLQDILLHTRWYLDNLEYLIQYRVRWVNYRSCNITKAKPLKRNV